MSTYVFKAMDLAGLPSKGEVDAESKQHVAEQLRQRNLIVLDIADKHSSKEINLEFFKKVTSEDLTIMTRQLATMVSSGMSILRALYVLEAQTENDKLVDAIVIVRKDVEAGLPLSDALERHPKIFSRLFVAMTRAGETGGVLDASLLRVADQLEKEDGLRRQIKSAMVYPAVVMTVAFGVLFALVTFLVPVFTGIFKQFGGNLPAITQVTVDLSHFCKSYFWTFPLIGAAVFYGFRRWKRSERGRVQWDRFRLRVPFKIGDIVQKVALARWSRTFSALVSAGVPLLQALEITGKTAGNAVIEQAMADVIASVKQGGTIAAPLRSSDIFPTMVSHMVGVGEETGAVDTMLSKIADFYEDQVEASVKALTSILEPVMIVVVGGIVGFIVISMYMPLFKVYDQIR
ncbi:MAG: type secretion system family protein [Solirubrobacteraceae bacterium]|nr:type secretion system family protein [Solirubrobacteraceae bacterium]